MKDGRQAKKEKTKAGRKDGERRKEGRKVKDCMRNEGEKEGGRESQIR